MQFIETSSLGVRAAVYHLGRSPGSLEFVLFPMLHIGSRGYYAAIRERLARCDYILAEGVSSRRAAALALSYRLVAKMRRFELVTQDALQVRSLGVKIVRTDMAGADFDREWIRIPLGDRLLVYIALPLYVLFMFFFGTKEFIARHAELDDLPNGEEVLYKPGEFERLDDLVVKQRDARLIHWIEKFDRYLDPHRQVVAVVWGAQHMRAVTRYLLDDLGYRVTRAEWLPVFEY